MPQVHDDQPKFKYTHFFSFQKMIKIQSQNIAGNKLKHRNNSGKLCPLIFSIRQKKPDILVLTETRHVENNFQGKNAFYGFRLTQSSANPEGRGGVLVYGNTKRIEIIENTELKSENGNFTAAGYFFEGHKIIIVGVYGPSCSDDRLAQEIFVEIRNAIEMLVNIVGTRNIIIVGDFNIHLDRENLKPRTCKLVREMMRQLGLRDLGERERENTWRRPGRNRNKSRIDYCFANCNLQTDMKTYWSGLDHARLEISITYEERERRRVLKDWVIEREDFQKEAKRVIGEIIYDHALNKRELENFREMSNNEIGKNAKVIDREEGIFYTHIFMIILQNVTNIQARIQRTVEENKRKEFINIQKQIKDKLGELDRSQNENEIRNLEEEISLLKTRLSNEIEEKIRAEDVVVEISREEIKGKQSVRSFNPIKERKESKNIKKLVIEERIIESQIEIAEIMKKRYQEVAGKERESEITLDEFLDKYEVELKKVRSKESMEVEVTEDEIRKALGNSKAGKTPGQSGQSATVLKFLFKEISYIMNRTVNEILFVPEFIDWKPFEWLKKRNIVYIKKPGKSSEEVEGYRPLSMLENLYKICTRVLTGRLAQGMEEVISDDQHGFRQGRSIATCTVPVLEALKDAEKNRKSLQLVAIDLKAAFDTIDPKVIKEVMQKQEFPESFVQAVDRTTSKGKAKIVVNGRGGEEFLLRNGTGQGDPPSAGRFSIGIDPLIRAVEKKTREMRYRLSIGKIAKNCIFADDNMLIVDLREGNIKEIIQVYEDYGKVSGLEINKKKTEVVCINTRDEIKQEIRDCGLEISEGIKYLGVEIRESYQESREESFKRIFEKGEKRKSRIQAAHVDLIHRRQLIVQTLIPMYTHIINAFGLEEQYEDKIDKQIRESLWVKKERNIEKRKRNIVARNRLAAEYDLGGMQIQMIGSRATGIACNIVKRIIQELENVGENKLEIAEYMDIIVRRIKGISLREIYLRGGYLTWIDLRNRMKRYSTFYAFLCESMGKLIEMNDKAGGMIGGFLVGNRQSPPLYVINMAEGIDLMRYGIKEISDIFLKDQLSGKIKNEDREYINWREEETYLITKCKKLRQEIGRKCNIEYANVTLSEIVKNRKPSEIYRKMDRAAIKREIKVPPSYKTRIKDGVSVPAPHIFMNGYNKIFRMGLTSKTLENSFLILNRQIWTRQKGYLSRIGGGGMGDVSYVESLNLQHI